MVFSPTELKSLAVIAPADHIMFHVQGAPITAARLLGMVLDPWASPVEGDDSHYWLAGLEVDADGDVVLVLHEGVPCQ